MTLDEKNHLKKLFTCTSEITGNDVHLRTVHVIITKLTALRKWNMQLSPLFRSPKGNGKNKRGSVKVVIMNHSLIKYSTV